eukprot:3428194-Amphidinium_carterae.1
MPKHQEPVRQSATTYGETNSTFSAIMAQHLTSTQVKVRQDIESVLSFAVALEAELAAILQDSPQRKDAQAMHASPTQLKS